MTSRRRRAGSFYVFLLSLWPLSSALSGPIVINEIHYTPRDKTVHEEFVELYNNGSVPEFLDGWTFSSGIDFTFSGTVLDPGEYVVVAQDRQAVVSLYGAVPVVGDFSGRLSNPGERITLRNSRGEVEDEVDYKRGFPWPTADKNLGFSIELVHPDLDNDLGGSWRLSNPSLDASNNLVSPGASWRYLKGTAEPSSPTSAWRQRTFNDAGWQVGAASIGYGEGFISTELTDMRNNYSTVYLRRTFQVDDPASIHALSLEVQYDDGFNAWINGVHVASDNVSSQEIAYNGDANNALENLDFVAFDPPRPVNYLFEGDNVLAIQLLNASVGGSTDAFIDVRLSTTAGGGAGPTPGAQNAVFSTTLPPHLRQVEHTPKRPLENEAVVITVKATDSDGVASVTLDYQIVEPGSYINLNDPEYATQWTSVTMKDDGDASDTVSGDDTYTVTLPGSLQVGRRLIRYRVTAEDGTGLHLTAPYADDPQPNFAYFVYYSGVPGWSGAIQPGSSDAERRRVVDYSSELLSQVPTYHLISKCSDVEDCTWFSRYGGSSYLWLGTLVYDDDVYDHIRYRARGGVWRYAMGKNMWKFDFYPGHRFQARDDYGRKYKTKWDKVNFSAIIQQGNFLHRGEQGLFEATGFRMFNLVGVEAPKTHYVNFRIIDEAAEFGGSQYEGDFWGLYLVVEQMDGLFLDEHDLPDGNLYKMEGGSGELNNLGFYGPKDKSDLNSYLATYESNPSNQWWRDNMDLDRYYSYRAIVEGIHHYDIAYGKNYFYYRNPDTGIWSTLPWDLDLTWANNMFGSGDHAFKNLVLSQAVFSTEYKNRMREIRDLLYNTDQAYEMIDEYTFMVEHPVGGPSLVDADRAMWDYNPIMQNGSIVNLSKAGQGRYYQQSSAKTFLGMAQLMKNYVVSRGNWIDTSIANDSAIPNRPRVTHTGPAGFPVDALTFSASSFSDPQGSGTFGAMEWRIAEVSPPGSPAFDPLNPKRYEIVPAWESEELTTYQSTITIPDTVPKIGHVHRVRVRMKDNTNRWSRWSQPVEFTVGEPTVASDPQLYLRITEIMYNPLGASEDLEFIELQNISPVPLDLTGVSFSDGIEFDFAGSDVDELPPGEFVLVVKNATLFGSTYDALGMNIAGEYSGKLRNGGERVLLRYGANAEILDFIYSDDWHPITDGFGHSLVIVDVEDDSASWGQPSSWHESNLVGGSPGRADSGPPPGGRQLPGDTNQDNFLDIGDAMNLLLQLVRGGAMAKPCEGTTIADGSNLILADFSGDGMVDFTDAIVLLEYLFLEGPSHNLGTFCVRIEGCPSVCR